MKLFLDVEWADVLASELVSIALVSDDGHHAFYGERNPLPAEPVPWVATVVYPLLERGTAAMPDRLLTKSLRTFLASIPAPTIIYDSPHDRALCQYVLDGLDEPEPEGPGPSITWLHLELDAARERWWRDHPKHQPRRHHAAMDALALRGAWLSQQGCSL
ncbi:hypothetical protein ABQJ54_14265 [Rhodanobacter sp. Si-c]|uniref:Uncharacterized protein n=1 Tax=Rhodanobacter lycopersici TaxID=3162487 RepID=A0ABV3QGF9_9GAMM